MGSRVLKFKFRVGLAAGTFSNTVAIGEIKDADYGEIYRETSLGLTYQVGIDFMIKDYKNRFRSWLSP